jgi:hypothetical protein
MFAQVRTGPWAKDNQEIPVNKTESKSLLFIECNIGNNIINTAIIVPKMVLIKFSGLIIDIIYKVSLFFWHYVQLFIRNYFRHHSGFLKFYCCFILIKIIMFVRKGGLGWGRSGCCMVKICLFF